MSGDWLMWPTQLTSRYDSNAPWAPEANKFERKSFRPQIAFGLELKKKKKKKKQKYGSGGFANTVRGFAKTNEAGGRFGQAHTSMGSRNKS